MPNRDSAELREHELWIELYEVYQCIGDTKAESKSRFDEAWAMVQAHTTAQVAAAEHRGALEYRNRMSTEGRPLSASPLIKKMAVPCPTCGAKEYADWSLYPHQVYNAVFPGGIGHDCLPCFCERLLSDDEVVASLRAHLTTGQKEETE